MNNIADFDQLLYCSKIEPQIINGINILFQAFFSNNLRNLYVNSACIFIH